MTSAILTNLSDNSGAERLATPQERDSAQPAPLRQAIDRLPAADPDPLPPPPKLHDPSPADAVRRVFNVLTIALFLAAIGVPLLDMVFKIDPTPSSEQRVLAPFPAKVVAQQGIGALPAAIKRYCEDNFGFRNLLIRLHGIVKVKGFGVSSNLKVVLGLRDTDDASVPDAHCQWLYYADHRTMDHHRALDLFTEQELQQWRGILEQRRDWLGKQGCKYLVVIAPNAQEIYPEYLPDGTRRVGKKTRTDQLIEHLRTHQSVDIVDTRAALHRARERDPRERLFHRTDTHWNDLGSFAGYEAIVPALKHWRPEIQPLSRRQFDVIPVIESGGDLAGTLGIKDQYQETWLNLEPKAPRQHRLPRESWHYYQVTCDGAASFGKPYVHADAQAIRGVHGDGATLRSPEVALTGGRLLMFRDSFGATLVPYLAEHFDRATFIWTDQFHRKRVEEERPNVVITQFIERLLMRKPPEHWSVE